MLGLVLLVLFVHFGGPNVPKVLKDNKQMVYGVIIGLILCSFFGVKVEGACANGGTVGIDCNEQWSPAIDIPVFGWKIPSRCSSGDGGCY